MKAMPTSFGDISLKLASDDSCSQLTLEGPSRNPPDTLWVHLDAWKGTKTMLPPNPGGGIRTIRLCKSGAVGNGSEVESPFRLHISIHTSSVSFERSGSHGVEVFTLGGKSVWRIQGMSPAIYSLGNVLGPGMYLLKAKWNRRSITGKIVIAANAK